ncbi:hypothetical protein RJ55_08363 [Drechmeria coniospora]|nr:hypothetical protein RJ55_08363 [Drechmeria coniospora]
MTKRKGKRGGKIKQFKTPPLDSGPSTSSCRNTTVGQRNLPPERGSGGTTTPASNQSLQKYDIVLSQKHLAERGFHPAVTDETREQLLGSYMQTVARYTKKRPSRSFYLDGGAGFRGVVVSQSRNLTRAFLTFRDGFAKERVDANLDKVPTKNKLSRLINFGDVGGFISEHIFATGLGTVHRAAMASTETWDAIFTSAKIWDFFAGELLENGPARVFIALAPEYTIGEFHYAETYDPYGQDADSPLASWFSEAITTEKDIYFSIQVLHRRLSKKRRHKPKLGPLTESLVALTRWLTDVKHLQASSQFISGPMAQVFDPPANFAVKRLRLLLKGIFERRKSLKVLYFQKTPYLDRRMLAIILRACTNVQMLAVYNCPLIHFGDVICLLDLIAEVNASRRAAGFPTITAFDFFPRYHGGMPFHDERAQTYGLTWGPQCLETVQRGFFCIVFKAFMKAKAMNLDLLYTKGNAFCNFLYRIPNYSLAIPTFLDALHRLLDLSKHRRPSTQDRKRLLYDLLKPVRVGLEERMDHDWPHWYTMIMGDCLLFCSSCGYETVQEFFTAHARDMLPHRRVCAGCLLQYKLDDEDDHLKGEKKSILTELFPGWNDRAFNPDAPLAPAARGLMNLISTCATPGPLPGPIIDGDGNLYQPRYELPFVRNNKMNMDSLQNLPSLDDLVTNPRFDKLWLVVGHRGNCLDMYSRLVRRLRDENAQVPHYGVMKPIAEARSDGAMPDHVEERQPRPVPGQYRLSRSFADIIALETKAFNLGYV